MKVTSLVENTTLCGLPVEHGLSLYIELDNGKRILFDMGQGSLFAENAERLGLSLQDIDVAFVSHGHYDHGGGLKTFLDVNSTARVYLHKLAFQPHFSLRDDGLKFIGLDTDLEDHSRLVMCGASTQIANDILGFSNVEGSSFVPVGNKRLIGPDKITADAFGHEQNLLVSEGQKFVLFAGCAHKGIVNILHKAMEVAGRVPTHVFAGMHLVKSGLQTEDENKLVSALATELQLFNNTRFFTMHCTGTEQFEKLSTIMGPQMEYLSCGGQVIV